MTLREKLFNTATDENIAVAEARASMIRDIVENQIKPACECAASLGKFYCDIHIAQKWRDCGYVEEILKLLSLPKDQGDEYELNAEIGLYNFIRCEWK